jgi:hypothetical protein
LPVTVVSVTVRGVNTYDDASRTIRSVELPVDEGFEDHGGLGVALTFDDEVLEIRRVDNQLGWRGLEIPPGDTLQAHVPNNRDLTIKYRRSGPLGIFERRSITIHGTV